MLRVFVWRCPASASAKHHFDRSDRGFSYWSLGSGHSVSACRAIETSRIERHLVTPEGMTPRIRMSLEQLDIIIKRI